MSTDTMTDQDVLDAYRDSGSRNWLPLLQEIREARYKTWVIVWRQQPSWVSRIPDSDLGDYWILDAVIAHGLGQPWQDSVMMALRY